MGWGSSTSRGGAKKFGMPLETREVKLFWRDIPGFCWDIPAVPEKFEKNRFVFNLWPLGKEKQHHFFHSTQQHNIRDSQSVRH